MKGLPTQRPFRLIQKDVQTSARAGQLITPHGVLETPAFMPVGTQGAVKTLDQEDLERLGYHMILANTYHLMLRPGFEILKGAGGLHKFMSWGGAILTDSGGYQAFSLAHRCRLTEEGFTFSSHVDGTKHMLTPESTTEFQLGIGSDILMCLDECPAYPASIAAARESMERTLRWARRCKEAYLKRILPDAGEKAQLLFGIVQGAGHPRLREESSVATIHIGFPGYAIGGIFVGEPKSDSFEFLEASITSLPADSPRYLMGAGQPEDIWEGVSHGVDLFDCVLPTRNARNGQALTSKGKLNLKNAQFRTDPGPLDTCCSCPACARYSRAYISHLFRAGEILAGRLVTLHNLSFMLGLTNQIRRAILSGNFAEEKKAFLETYRSTGNLTH
jgi:queuine tRNA-ribosyltransferase